MRLNFSYITEVDSAYIITLLGHEQSEAMASRCLKSCEDVGQNATLWPAYDGTSGVITTPDHHNDVMRCIKQVDHELSIGEVGCALSHISLWAKCVLDDKPLIVLEHDAIMLKPYRNHAVFNSIGYLGCTEQQNQGWAVLPTPPHATNGKNYHFMCRAHAYAIDPAVAKNMLAHVIKYGIHESLDIMLRADIFPIHQTELYAYNMPSPTTILDRKTDAKGEQR